MKCIALLFILLFLAALIIAIAENDYIEDEE